MIFAVDKEGNRLETTKEKKGFCPVCDEELVARMGQINIWHWAHKINTDCEANKPQTRWHLDWKELVPKESREVVVVKKGKTKIADIKIKNITVEIQSSSISPEEIRIRENHYEVLYWIFLIHKKTLKNIYFRHREKNIFTFRWKWPRKTLEYISRPLFIDLGGRFLEEHNGLLEVKRIYYGECCGGWGYIHEKKSVNAALPFLFR